MVDGPGSCLSWMVVGRGGPTGSCTAELWDRIRGGPWELNIPGEGLGGRGDMSRPGRGMRGRGPRGLGPALKSRGRPLAMARPGGPGTGEEGLAGRPAGRLDGERGASGIETGGGRA